MHSDAEPMGVAVAVAIGDVFATTLPPGLLTTAHWDNLVKAADKNPTAGSGWAPLHEEYLFHAAPLGNGHLLVAVHQARVHPFRNMLIKLSVGLVLAVLGLTLGVMTWVVGRVLSPVATLTRAADLLGRGQLTRSRSLFGELAERPDEVGALARAQLMATAHLHAAVKTSQRLLRHIESCIAQVDTMAAAVATSATRQEDRLIEVTDILDPLMKALIQTSQGLQDAHRIVTTLSLSSTAADQMQAILSTAVRRAEALLNVKDKDKDKDKDGVEPRGLRTASVLQQAGVISQAVADQREVFQKVRDGVSSLRSCIEDALGGTRVEPQGGQQALRAATEIGRLAKLHGQESAALHTVAEQLRRDLSELQKQLATLDARGSEEALRGPVDDRQVGASAADHAAVGDTADQEAGRRRADRLRASPAPSGSARRGVGASSSQSLAPVAGSAPERKTGTVSNSGTGYKPVGRSSGNYPKVGGAHESVPSGSSFRAISVPAAGGPGASTSGGTASAKGATAASASSLGGAGSVGSLGGSSATVRPIAASPGTGPSRVPPGQSGSSAASLGGTPAKGVPVASASSLGGAAIGASSSSLRPVATNLHSGPNRGASAPPTSSATSLGGTPAKGVPIASASSLGGSSGSLRPVAVSYNPSAGKSSLLSAHEAGASAKSLRSDLADPASAQSLNSTAPGRRK